MLTGKEQSWETAFPQNKKTRCFANKILRFLYYCFAIDIGNDIDPIPL